MSEFWNNMFIAGALLESLIIPAFLIFMLETEMYSKYRNARDFEYPDAKRKYARKLVVSYGAFILAILLPWLAACCGLVFGIWWCSRGVRRVFIDAFAEPR